MRPAPYIGLSGVMRRAEVRGALAAFPDCGRQLMVGALASEKTLAGRGNKYPRRYPWRDDIAGIFSDDTRLLNLVHVAVDALSPKEPWLERAFVFGGSKCHGVQLNMPEPKDRDAELVQLRSIRCFKYIYLEARLVVQLRSSDPENLVRRCIELQDAGATDVLLDASGGRGLDIDVPSTVLAAQRIRAACPELGVGIAGGLCADTVPLVAGAIASGISIDAEGKLRDGADGGGNLDLRKVGAYLRAAGEAVSP